MTARVLIVDDMLPSVKMLAAKLSGEYYEILTAHDGPTALEVAETQDPDLILLDVMMPGMEGDVFCRLIKGREESGDIPIILVSTKDEKELQELVEDVGADDYMWKAKVNAHELKKIIYKHSW